MYLLVLVQFLFSISFILSKKNLIYGSPFFIAGIRMFIASFILLSIQFFYDKKSFKNLLISRESWGLIFLSALLNVYVTNAYELWGMQYVTASKISLIYTFSPFITALLSYLVLKEGLSFKKLLGLIIGLLGLIPILGPDVSTENSINLISMGEIAIFVAAIANAYGWIAIKQLTLQRGFSINLINGITMFIGGVISIIHSFATEPLIFDENMNFWVYVLMAAIILHILAYSLYTYLLELYTVTFMSFSNFIAPFITCFFSWFFLKEQITYYFFISTAIVFVGLYLFYFEEMSQKDKGRA